MDETTLASLEAALAASPENAVLRVVVARACHEIGDADRARQHLEGLDGDLAPGDRLFAAQVHLDAGDAARALELTGSTDAPEALIVRARALLLLDRTVEAREAFQRAVEANPTLEDRELKARIGAATSSRGGDGPRLRVIDTQRASDEVRAMLVPEVERVTFADVGGLESVKEQVERRIILPFQKPSLFQRFKKRAGGGLLLYGPPGCGKTLLARATAGECRATFFNVAISDVLDMWMGESESKLHAIFEKARSSTPAVMFFDEIEALGGKRQYSRSSALATLVSHFLSEMDGFAQRNDGVLILAATNVPWDVDAAFRRPGRFDRTLFVPPPDRAAREAILRIHLAGRPVEGAVDVAQLAKRTSGFSGADLHALVEAAADGAIAESLEAGAERPIRDRHLQDAVKEVRPTTTEWLTTARNYARYSNEGGAYDEVLAFLEKHGKA